MLAEEQHKSEKREQCLKHRENRKLRVLESGKVWKENPKPADAVWVESRTCDKAYWVKFSPPSWYHDTTPVSPSGWDDGGSLSSPKFPASSSVPQVQQPDTVNDIPLSKGSNRTLKS